MPITLPNLLSDLLGIMMGETPGQDENANRPVAGWSAAAALRLKEAVAAYGSQRDVAEQIGINRASLAEILNNRARPKRGNLDKICRVVGVEPGVILGRGRSHEVVDGLAEALNSNEAISKRFTSEVLSAFNDGGTAVANESEKAALAALVFVPFDQVFASAGPGALALEERRTDDFIGFPKASLKQWFGSYDQLRLVGIKGDSMEPTLSDGDLAMIDLARREPSDGVYALVLDGMLLVKRLALVRSGVVRVISDNKQVDEPRDIDLEAEADNFRVVGRVVWAGGKL